MTGSMEGSAPTRLFAGLADSKMSTPGCLRRMWLDKPRRANVFRHFSQVASSRCVPDKCWTEFVEDASNDDVGGDNIGVEDNAGPICGLCEGCDEDDACDICCGRGKYADDDVDDCSEICEC